MVEFDEYNFVAPGVSFESHKKWDESEIEIVPGKWEIFKNLKYRKIKKFDKTPPSGAGAKKGKILIFSVLIIVRYESYQWCLKVIKIL